MDIESKLPASATLPSDDKSMPGGGTGVEAPCVVGKVEVTRRVRTARSDAAEANKELNLIVQAATFAAGAYVTSNPD